MCYLGRLVGSYRKSRLLNMSLPGMFMSKKKDEEKEKENRR